MMYHKAITFNDMKAANEILQQPNPRICKAIGRTIRDFDDEEWDKVKVSIVEQGSYLKFTRGGKKLRAMLLATGERELIEASRFDRVWGIGFSIEGIRAGVGREMWGENLLGKVLMATRKRIREEEAMLSEKVKKDNQLRADTLIRKSK